MMALTETSLNFFVHLDGSLIFTLKQYRFYHSDGDNFENIKNLDQLCGLASTVARSLFFLAGGGEDMDETDETDGQIDLNANCSLVGELTECLASNWSCPLGFFFHFFFSC